MQLRPQNRNPLGIVGGNDHHPAGLTRSPNGLGVWVAHGTLHGFGTHLRGNQHDLAQLMQQGKVTCLAQPNERTCVARGFHRGSSVGPVRSAIVLISCAYSSSPYSTTGICNARSKSINLTIGKAASSAALPRDNRCSQ